jgi:uncharacterized membrane protein
MEYLLAMIPTFLLGFIWGFILCSVNSTYQKRKLQKQDYDVDVDENGPFIISKKRSMI